MVKKDVWFSIHNGKKVSFNEFIKMIENQYGETVDECIVNAIAKPFCEFQETIRKYVSNAGNYSIDCLNKIIDEFKALKKPDTRECYMEEIYYRAKGYLCCCYYEDGILDDYTLIKLLEDAYNNVLYDYCPFK